MRRRDFLAAIGCLVVLITISGCGGGSATNPAGPGQGGINVAVVFPDATSDAPAIIPSHAESVVVSVTTQSNCSVCVAHIASQAADVPSGLVTINKPAGGGVARATIGGLDPGTYHVSASAHSAADGGGDTIATAHVTTTVRSGQTTDVPMTLVQTVAQVLVSPPKVVMLPGEQAQLAIEVKDPTIIGASLDVTSSVTGVATTTATGQLHAVNLGQTTVTVRHAASGNQATSTVHVVSARVARVVVTSDLPATAPGHPVPFMATALNGQDNPVALQFDWRVDPTSAGSIDANGLFTPANVGVARIFAEEVISDVEGSATIRVTDWVVVLDWTSGDDLDLHVFDSTQTKQAYYGQPVAPQGELLADSTRAPGLEIFAGASGVQGVFPVGVNYFRGKGNISGTARLFASGQAPVIQPFQLSRENNDGGYPVTNPTPSWARPFDVVVGAGGVSSQTADTSIALGPPPGQAK